MSYSYRLNMGNRKIGQFENGSTFETEFGAHQALGARLSKLHPGNWVPNTHGFEFMCAGNVSDLVIERAALKHVRKETVAGKHYIFQYVFRNGDCGDYCAG